MHIGVQCVYSLATRSHDSLGSILLPFGISAMPRLAIYTSPLLFNRKNDLCGNERCSPLHFCLVHRWLHVAGNYSGGKWDRVFPKLPCSISKWRPLSLDDYCARKKGLDIPVAAFDEEHSIAYTIVVLFPVLFCVLQNIRIEFSRQIGIEGQLSCDYDRVVFFGDRVINTGVCAVPVEDAVAGKYKVYLMYVWL